MASEPATIIAFYQFADLEDFETMRDPLLAFCKQQKIFGSILLAQEGINGTVAGSKEAIDNLLDRLRSDGRLAALEAKFSTAVTPPFHRMKVRLKKEIVTLRQPDVDPVGNVGEYVDAKDWNELISDPDVVIIDTRNDYEVELGQFKGATDPKTKSFGELPDWVDQNLDPQKTNKVAMYCTGGIRCEKATALMKQKGFDKVYHLKGGILKYFEEVASEESLWEGECFVFDDRVSVDHELNPGSFDLCHGCRMPITEKDKQAPEYERGVSCPRCFQETSEKHKASMRQRQIQIDLAVKEGRVHLGPQASKPTQSVN